MEKEKSLKFLNECLEKLKNMTQEEFDARDKEIQAILERENSEPLSSHAVLCAVPIVAGDSYGIQFLCSACDFPKDETLTMDMKHCWNCGVKLDWEKCDY
jgi:hypothetical protein